MYVAPSSSCARGATRRQIALGVGASALSGLSACDTAGRGAFTARASKRVFDDVVGIIERDHYLADGTSPAWRAWRGASADARGRLSGVQDWNGLYFEVLWPAIQSLGDSHTYLTPHRPKSDAQQEAASSTAGGPVVSVDQAEQRWRGDIDAGLGFRLASTPDGKTATYGLVRGSPGEIHGVAPGSLIRSYSLSSRGSRPPLFRGDVIGPDGQARVVTFELATAEAAPPFSVSAHPAALAVRFDLFSEPLVTQVLSAMRAHDRPIVLDLRLNVGGDVTALEALAGGLVGPGKTLGTMAAARRSEAVTTGRHAQTITRPLAILAGPGTQSAAEVATDALRFLGRAKVFGRRTAGQVLASSGYTLSDGGTLRVATKNFISVSGRRLEQRGAEPDEVITETLSDVRQGTDPVLVAALQHLAGAAA